MDPSHSAATAAASARARALLRMAEAGLLTDPGQSARLRLRLRHAAGTLYRHSRDAGWPAGVATLLLRLCRLGGAQRPFPAMAAACGRALVRRYIGQSWALALAGEALLTSALERNRPDQFRLGAALLRRARRTARAA